MHSGIGDAVQKFRKNRILSLKRFPIWYGGSSLVRFTQKTPERRVSILHHHQNLFYFHHSHPNILGFLARPCSAGTRGKVQATQAIAYVENKRYHAHGLDPGIYHTHKAKHMPTTMQTSSVLAGDDIMRCRIRSSGVSQNRGLAALVQCPGQYVIVHAEDQEFSRICSRACHCPLFWMGLWSSSFPHGHESSYLSIWQRSLILIS